MIRFKSLSRDERGASIIELALVAPVLASLLIGMVDLSRAYSAKLQLEQAAQRAIEEVQQYQATSSTYGTLQTEAAQAARDSGFTNVQDSDVTVDFWLECNGVREASYNDSCDTAAGENQMRFISVDVKGTFTPLFRSKVYPRANADGTFTLHGIAGMRTQ
jgi:Flp pilus assembly protein TadG